MSVRKERLCADCNGPLHGRMDKKFCNDHCRSNYNNSLRAESSDTIKAVNLILKKNRDILERITLNGQSRINRLQLCSAGFDLHYHTHTFYTENAELYICCYEYGYQELNRDEFLVAEMQKNK